MAGFHTKTFTEHDDYMTPKSAWEAIAHLIPSGKIIWEPFYGDGRSGEFLRELGFQVIHENENFFENDRGEIIISNPPFSKAKEVLRRLKELGKPFILILPSPKIHTNYVREFFRDTDPLQIVVPRKRIHFIKTINGKVPDDYKSSCNFDCFYYCWKIGLPRDITWLE